MLRPLTSLKFSALALALVPLVAATQQAPGGTQVVTSGGQQSPAGGQQAPGSDQKANQPDKAAPSNNPGTVAPGKDKPQQNGKKTSTPGSPDAAHPNGTGVPVEVGDPWDSLKLDSKVRIKLSFRNANVDNVIAMLQQASHITIVKDPVLVGPVTVTTADPVSLTEAFHVFNSVLKLKGFELSRDRKILVITRPKPPAPPPPPPPPGGMRIPPPPGGGPMPPPPPMGMREEDIFMKLGMKRKKKWNLENPTKRTNWKSVSKKLRLNPEIPPQKLTFLLILYQH